LIGVEKNATTDEIKKAFRKRALKEHPDKGGDPEKVPNSINNVEFSSRNSRLLMKFLVTQKRESSTINMVKKAYKEVHKHKAFLTSSISLVWVVEAANSNNRKESSPLLIKLK
jgi:hypothetical protein